MSEDWNSIVHKKLGFDAKHLTLSHSTWIIESWDKSLYPELIKNDSSLLSKLDKLHQNLATSPKLNEGPLTRQLITGKNHFIQQSIGKNILTSEGMTEMSKRSTGQTSSINDYHAVGTGTTTETIADLILENEIGRKVIGTKNTVNQTERYSTSFADIDITAPPQFISEAAIFTEMAGGIMIMRITGVPVELDIGKLVSVLTTVTHQNGVEL